MKQGGCYVLRHAGLSPTLSRTAEPVLLGGYERRKKWNASLGLRSVAEVNAAVVESRTKFVVQAANAMALLIITHQGANHHPSSSRYHSSTQPVCRAG